MRQVIIFPQETGIAVIYPTGEISTEATALKDVPSGVKFKIVNESDLPEDKTFFDAWEFDFINDYDGIGQ